MKSGKDHYVTVKIFRFDPSIHSEPRYDTFQVRYDEEETILGVLKDIAQHRDPTLVFRESCRIGNCGICTVKVNGKPVLACRKTLEDFDIDKIVIDPLHENNVICDLVCEM